MVTKATNNIEDKPFIPLDFQAFADKRPHAAGEVRNVLRSRISQVTEVPEEIGGDREARHRGAEVPGAPTDALEAEYERGDREAEGHEADGAGRAEVEDEAGQEPGEHGMPRAREEGDASDEDEPEVRASVPESNVGGERKLEHEADDGEHGRRADLTVSVYDLHAASPTRPNPCRRPLRSGRPPGRPPRRPSPRA